MIKLLRAMWYASLPLIAVAVILAAMYGVAYGFRSLGLGEVPSILLSFVVLIYVFLVVIFYKIIFYKK